MIAGTGTAMERDHDWHSALHWESLKTPAEIGRTAGPRAGFRMLHFSAQWPAGNWQPAAVAFL